MPLVEYETQITRRLAGEPVDPFAYAPRTRLLADCESGATSVVVDGWTAGGAGLIVIDPYSAECEVRRVTSAVVGIGGETTIGFGAALLYAHDEDDAIFYHAGALNAAWFGAAGDGVTDDAPALLAAVAALGYIGGGALNIPTGDYAVADDTSLSVPSDSIVYGDGAGATVIRLGRDSTGHTFWCNGVENVTISDLTVLRTEIRTATPTKTNAAVEIDASTHILIENVDAVGTFFGFNIGSNSAITNTDITLSHCRALQPAAYTTAYQCSYGIQAKYCDGLKLLNCEFDGWWLDGIKINRNTVNVQIIACKSNNNGVSVDYGLNGNGIDTYAGSKEVLLLGGEYRNNGGAGIYAKATVGENSDAGGYGTARGLRVIGVIASGNTSSGLSYQDNGLPVFQGQILGGCFDDNATYGIYLAARQISVEGVVCRKNQQEGIYIASESWGIVLVAPQVIANSQASAGTYHGISVNGQQIQIVAAHIDGADSNDLTEVSEYSALTKYHNRSISIGASAVNVAVRDGIYQNQASAGTPIRVDSGAQSVTVNGAFSVSPEGVLASGTGSFMLSRADGKAYIKTTAAGVATGWVALATV